MRRINTRVTVDIETDRVEERQAYLYDGPLELAIDAGPSAETQQKETDIGAQQLKLSQQANARSQKLFDVTSPGLEAAETYYSGLATGDPEKILREIGPAAEEINRAGAGAKERIATEMPRGGEQRIAEEQVEQQKAGQIGRLYTTSYTSAFPSLAQLANTGIGLSINEMAQALTGLSGASATTANVANQQAEGKAATLGFVGALGQAGGMAAAGACWIAERLYGKLDPRTHMLRQWLRERSGFWVWMYRRYGERVARWPIWLLRLLFAGVFDHMLNKAADECVEQMAETEGWR